MRLLFIKSKTKQTSKLEQQSEGFKLLRHMLHAVRVCIGILTLTKMKPVLSWHPTSSDGESIKAPLTSNEIDIADANKASLAQNKPRDGLIYEEWDKLETVMTESRACAEELSSLVETAKCRRQRRERGENTETFIAPIKFRSVV
jgi:hypothetical protein